MRRLLAGSSLLLAGCGDRTPLIVPDLELPPVAAVAHHESVVCADPDARAEKPFDLVDDTSGAGGAWGAQRRGTTAAPTGGAAIGDLDGDGTVDIVLANPYASELYLGNRDGTWTRDDARLPGLASWNALGALLVDLDGDRDLDLYLPSGGRNAYYENAGDGTFVERASELGISDGDHQSLSAAAGDVDGDGDLDLVVANHSIYGGTVGKDNLATGDPNGLYLQAEDGTFRDASDNLEVGDGRCSYGLAFAALIADADEDGHADLIVANDKRYPNGNRYANGNGDGTWREGDPASGLYSSVGGMGISLFDTGDGHPSFLVGGWSVNAALFWTAPDRWYDAAASVGLNPDNETRMVAWSPQSADFGNDGQPDVVIGYGPHNVGGDVDPEGNHLTPPTQPLSLLIQDDGSFVERAAASGVEIVGVLHHLVVGDIDRNGWPDLLVRDRAGAATLAMSRCGDASWLEVTLDGPGANPRGIGAAVHVTGSEGTLWTDWIQAGGEGVGTSGLAEAHFGLGDETAATVEITWPDGARSRHDLDLPPGGNRLTIRRN